MRTVLLVVASSLVCIIAAQETLNMSAYYTVEHLDDENVRESRRTCRKLEPKKELAGNFEQEGPYGEFALTVVDDEDNEVYGYVFVANAN